MFLFPLIFNKFLLFYLFTWYVVRNTYNKSVRVVFLSWTSEAISFIKTPTLVFSKTRFFSIETEKIAFFTRMSIIYVYNILKLLFIYNYILMQNNRKMNLQELKSFGREMSRTKWRGRSLFLIGLTLGFSGSLLGFGAGIGTELLGWTPETTKEIINWIATLADLLIIAMFVPLILGWAKKEDLWFSDFWCMITRKETFKIFGVQLLVEIIITGLALLWGGLAWVIDTEIGGGQSSSIAILCIALIGITAFGLLAIRFSFVNQAIADKNLGIIEGFKYSWKITENHFWDLIRFHIYFLLWNILGLLCLIIGFIWTSAMRQIAFSKLYLELSEQADKAE